MSSELLGQALSERLAPMLPPGMTVVVTTADLADRMGDGDDDRQIAVLLSDIADEASEHTTERYEGDAVIDGDSLRIWFGAVPPGSRDRPFRDVLPELEPIPLDAITGG